MPEKRVEARMLCADMVDVRWWDKSGRAFNGSAILEDISNSGACLQLDAPVPLETTMQITYPKGQLEGTVKYCVFRDIGYFVGLEFTSDSKWSREEFEPRHLLDLHSLLERGIENANKRAVKESVQ